MNADLERPYIYAINRSPVGFEDTLIIIDAMSEEIVETMAIGYQVTDFAVHHGEDRLYITNWERDTTRVVDLLTFTELTPLRLGTDVYIINAGRPGRIYVESNVSSATVRVIDTQTGQVVGGTGVGIGDSEIDHTGNFYYHGTRGFSSSKIYKFDVSTDVPVAISQSMEDPPGSRNLLISPDGTRLFWRGRMYDKDLNELGIFLGHDFYATTLHGELGFSGSKVIDTRTGEQLYNLIYSSGVIAITKDQQKVFIFDNYNREIKVIPMSSIASIPPPGLNPLPRNNSIVLSSANFLSWDINPLAVKYEVFFGENESDVINADTTSYTYLGTFIENKVELASPLEPGKTYFWRIDQVGFTDVTFGDVFQFTIAPIEILPLELSFYSPVENTSIKDKLILHSNVSTQSWQINESISWFSLSRYSGVTPDTVEITIEPEGLPINYFSDSIRLYVEDDSMDIPVNLTVFEMNLSKLVTDYERPFIYGIHRGMADLDNSLLLFFNTDSNKVSRVIPIGSNPTDLTIHYGEDKIYITNWQRVYTTVVDIVTQSNLPPMILGVDGTKINAGRYGRIYLEDHDTWIINTQLEEYVGHIDIDAGDGEVDSTGNFYYHCDRNSSDARIHKYDISTDLPIKLGQSAAHPLGTSNLILSRNGRRLFWKSFAFKSNLSELKSLNQEIYATNYDGNLACSINRILYAPTGYSFMTFPVQSKVMAFSNDQRKLVLFDSTSHELFILSIEDDFEFVCGDFNDDSLVNIADLFILQNFYFAHCETPEGPFSSFDINCDTRINIADIIHLSHYINGTIQQLCCDY